MTRRIALNAMVATLYAATSRGESGPAARKTAATELRRDARLVSLLRNAIDNAAGEDGWSQLGAVGSQIANQASFDPRNHGFRKLADLIEALGLFEIDKRGSHLYVRERRKPAAVA